jgi:hypothetical protein
LVGHKMGLLKNYSQLNGNCTRYVGGTSSAGAYLANTPANLDLLADGKKNGRYELFSKYGGIPEGYTQPYSPILPIKNGGMSMGGSIAIDATNNNMVMGINLEQDMAGQIDGSLNCGLIVGFSCYIEASIDGSLDLQNILLFNCDMTGSIDGSMTLRSISDFNCSMLSEINGTITGNVLVNMSMDIGDAEELSAEGLANAVWNSLATAFNTAGTMGSKLNSAGAAANPWDAVIDTEGLTAGEYMRLLGAVAGGKSSVVFIGGVTYQVTFSALGDESKIVVDATVVNSERTDLVLDLTE